MRAEKRRRAARCLSGSGIEIGALHDPLPVPAGVEVKYVDRLTTEQLRAQYPELGDQPLVPVSYIGDAHDLSAMGDGSVDFVIANHVLEHLENPIRALSEMARVLRGGGILYIALPEPRVSFDKHRRLTTVDHVLDEFRNGTAASREEHFRDWVDNVEANMQDGHPKPDAEGRERRRRELLDADYSIHFHVWRPDTFMAFLVTACAEAGLELEPLEFIPCLEDDDEFIFVFSKGISATPPPVPALGAEHVVGLNGHHGLAWSTARLARRAARRTARRLIRGR
jgi:SAM-dependent methyltransferase